VEKYCRDGDATDDSIILRMLFAGCIPKAIDTHAEYAILIALPRQRWLRERASVLRYTYIAYLVCILKQTAMIYLHSTNGLVFIIEMKCVYCTVRSESSNRSQVTFRL
jgi:hypothetical protein